eukprot:6006152-Alexandrium_andersonii.AAC.1
MSASLVGSEMCIRDSPRSPIRPRARLTRQAHRQSLRPRGVSAQSAGIPVSYTHLTLPTICSV